MLYGFVGIPERPERLGAPLSRASGAAWPKGPVRAGSQEPQSTERAHFLIGEQCGIQRVLVRERGRFLGDSEGAAAPISGAPNATQRDSTPANCRLMAKKPPRLSFGEGQQFFGRCRKAETGSCRSARVAPR